MPAGVPDRATPLVVSPRGQITLPKRVRTHLRLSSGSVLLLREEGGRLVLEPAAVTAVEQYSDEEIERLVAADRATPRERARLRRRWGLKNPTARRAARG